VNGCLAPESRNVPNDHDSSAGMQLVSWREWRARGHPLRPWRRISRRLRGASIAGSAQFAIRAPVTLLLVACAPPAGAPPARATLDVAELLAGADTLHERAVEPRPFSFPADHGAHPGFRTEWWYFTGNVTAGDGRELGYQLTFFRSALADTASYVAGLVPAPEQSGWRSRHAYMAHFAVSDITAARLHAHERFARGAHGLAGAEAAPFRVWLASWRAAGTAGFFPVRLQATAGDLAIDLVLEAGKPMVLHGEGGLSRKGPEPGNASYYYSFTRMPTRGSVRVGGRSYDVSGSSWLDREWSTSVLAPGVEGWDWLALQLEDGSELMLYRLRHGDGGADPFSAGTYVAADGTTMALSADAFTLTPTGTWRSPLDGTSYPTTWRVVVPGLDLSLEVAAAFAAQELNLSVRYWEGAVRAAGSRAGQDVSGRGYLEMTGYAPAGTGAERQRAAARGSSG
jgi:predicted secreted hydrolase